MNDWLQYLPGLEDARTDLRTHWRKGALVAGGLFLALGVVTFALPRTYYSEAKLLVKAGWESLSLDPTATTGQTVSIYESRESEINSILEVLRSREVTEGVVDLLGVNAILHGGPLPDLSAQEIAADAGHGQLKIAPREQACLAIESGMQIWSPKKSNIIILRCEADSPQLAQAVNKAFLMVFQNVHADVNRTKGSFAFFTEQERVLREKWQLATAALRDAKDRIGVSTVDGRRAMLEGQLSDVQQKLLQTEGEIAAAEGKLAAVRQKLEQTPKFTETSRAENTNSAADAVFYQLQAKEKELAARFTDRHPQLVDLREQLTTLKQSLDRQGARVQSTSSINPSWSFLESSLLNERSSLDALRARIVSLKQQREALQQQLKQLNHDGIHLAELQQAADIAEKSHYETAQRLEQARVHQELAAERVTNVNVFQPASYVSKAIAPQRSIILALGLFLSVFAGCGAIVGLAYLERQFKTAAEISHRLKLPVAATLPAGALYPALS